MVELKRYGPVLDTAIDLVKEMTHGGAAELRVPRHPEAAGMAVDALDLLRSLYAHTDAVIFLPQGLPVSVPGMQDAGARRYRLNIVFNNAPFEMPDAKSFLTYPYTTIIDVDAADRPTFKTRINVVTEETPHKYQRQRGLAAIMPAGLELPPERRRITLGFGYQSVSDFPVGTHYQHFEPVTNFMRAQENRTISNYPVSAKKNHELDYNSWEFFRLPAFWDSWSQYLALALYKMAGQRNYDDTAEYYGIEIDQITRHAQKAEQAVVDIIRTLKEGDDIFRVTDAVGCPAEYRGIYLSKVRRSVGWFCNPASLNDAAKRQYLHKLAATCADYGLKITPKELSVLGSTFKGAA